MTKSVVVVNNQKELDVFNSIWGKVWLQSGFDLEFSIGFLLQLIFLNKKSKPIGTLEVLFEPKITNEQLVTKHINFFDFIGKNEKIAEIDKLAVLKEHSLDYSVLKNILTIIYLVGKTKQLDKFIALFEPKVFNILQKIGIPVESYGEPFEYKGGMVQAGAINLRKELNKVTKRLWINKDLEKMILNELEEAILEELHQTV